MKGSWLLGLIWGVWSGGVGAEEARSLPHQHPPSQAVCNHCHTSNFFKKHYTVLNATCLECHYNYRSMYELTLPREKVNEKAPEAGGASEQVK